MAASTKKSSSRWRATDWPKSVGIYGMRTIDRCAMCIYSAVTSALAICVLGLLLLPEIRSLFRRQSMTPNPTTRKLPVPVRQGSDIFAIMPDGERVKVDPLAAKTHAMAWVDVISGLAVYQGTKLPD